MLTAHKGWPFALHRPFRDKEARDLHTDKIINSLQKQDNPNSMCLTPGSQHERQK